MLKHFFAIGLLVPFIAVASAAYANPGSANSQANSYRDDGSRVCSYNGGAKFSQWTCH